MDPERYHRQIDTQSRALQDAARCTGPDVPVPTCPGWTMRTLVSHQAGMHAWGTDATTMPAGSHKPQMREQPQDWDALLAWADARAVELVERLRELGPEAPCWCFRSAPQLVGSWSRRAAHETAIHRLDAEFALAGNSGADAVPSLLFDSDLAADGIDEYLGVILPTARRRKEPVSVEGTVLYHAADAGRAWLVTLHSDAPLTVTKRMKIDADATVAGTADAVFRAIWGRPSSASVTGDTTLLEPLVAP